MSEIKNYDKDIGNEIFNVDAQLKKPRGRGRPKKINCDDDIKHKSNLIIEISGENTNVVNLEDRRHNKKTKSMIFAKERAEVVNKLNNILAIDGDKGFFNIDNLDETKITKILDLAEDVKKFFVYTNLGYFKDPYTKKGHISLLKSIYKMTNYTVRQSVSYTITKGVKTAINNIFVEKNSD